MLQWPKESCYVDNTLFGNLYKFPPKHYQVYLVYFWPGKKSFQNAKKFLQSLLGVKKNTSTLDNQNQETKMLKN